MNNAASAGHLNTRNTRANRKSASRKPLTLALAALMLSAAALPASAGWWTTSPSLSIGSTTVNVRNKGALGDGRHNDTSAIQAAINALPSSGGTVYVPAGRYMIDAVKSLNLHSHTRLKMDPGAQLVAIPNSASWSYVVRAWQQTDVEIVGGQIIGERAQHKGSTGEWGMGVSILASTNVYVHDLQVSDCWGDGIYVGDRGTRSGRIISQNVTLNHVVSTNNRRQGLSITPADKVFVVNSTFSNSHGTLPEAGIDIEPMTMGNSNRIRIQNSVLSGNNGNGLEIHDHVTHVGIAKNTIKGNRGFGIYAGSPKYMGIRHNLITQNGLAGISLNHSTSTVTVAYDTIAYNSTRYVPISSSYSDLARDVKVSSGTTGISVYSNTYSH